MVEAVFPALEKLSPSQQNLLKSENSKSYIYDSLTWSFQSLASEILLHGS